MIEPKNGYVAIKKPTIKEMTDGGIRKSDKMINQEIWRPSTRFEILAIDTQSGMDILPGDKVYLNAAEVGQVLVIIEDSKEIYMVSSYTIVGIAHKVPRVAKNRAAIDPDFTDQSIIDTPEGKAVVMGQRGNS